MENATKALLIAAAVLVAILIISLGIGIFNMSSEAADPGATMSSMEIQQFNKKYEQYEGIRGGTTVKKLLGYAIEDNDFLNSGRDAHVQVGVNVRSNITELINAFPGWGNALTTRNEGVSHTTNISKIRNWIKPSSKYKIWFEYSKSGLIHDLHIDKPYE